MRFLLSIGVLFLLAALGFAGYSFYQWQKPGMPVGTTTIIEPGHGSWDILTQLHEEGVTPAPHMLLLPFLLSHKHGTLKAGEYLFEPGMSAHAVLTRIAEGKVVVHRVTIPEGFTVAQARARLLAEPLLTGDLPARIPEGSLFPDTWQFQRGESRARLVARMQARMQQELADAWAARAEGLPLRTMQEALTLASIVEEETSIPDERGQVAGVYLNRLRLPMRLQSDPTVAYGIAPGGMGRMLTRADLARDTPYNTYTRDGLPPGPICNPGRASLLAAVQPAVTDALYFVATGDGGHRFAATHREHTTNVRAYRAVQRQQRAKQQ